jgi:hypothetical protein
MRSDMATRFRFLGAPAAASLQASDQQAQRSPFEQHPHGGRSCANQDFLDS